MELDAKERARQLCRAADESLASGDYRAALNSLVAVTELLPADQHAALAGISGNIGHLYVRLENFDQAVASFEKARQLFVQIGDRVATAEQYGNIGSTFRDREIWEPALENYRRALDIFEKLGHTAGLAAQYSNIGYACSGKGDLDSAIRNFRMAQGHFDQLGDAGKSGDCQQNIQALESMRTRQKGQRSCCIRTIGLDCSDATSDST